MRKIGSTIFMFFGLLLAISCTTPEWTIATNNGDEFSNLTFKNHPLNAVVFLAPGCPLSEASIQSLNKLQEKYTAENLATFIVIPGSLYTNEEVKAFIDTFAITIPVVIDTEAILVKKLKATITPEYFLLDKDMQVVYQGAIDDRAFDNEYIRQSARINFADSAIHQFLTKNKIAITKTKAVGCFIEL